MNRVKYILYLILILCTSAFSQVVKDKLIDVNTGLNINPDENDQIIANPDLYILDSQISPMEYILGPGDQLGLNIVTAVSKTYRLLVSPTGDLVIPLIGIVNVGEMTINDAELKVRKYILSNVFPSAKVDMVLANIREYKVKVLGAVNKPGYVRISSHQRLYDVIQEAGGFHRDADESKVVINRKNGNKIHSSLKYYNNIHDNSNNPIIRFEDIVDVPFDNITNEIVKKIITAKQNPINVTGYAHKPGEYPYYMGFTIVDYINMAGGPKDNGSIKKIRLYRKGITLNPTLTDYILPGDQIYIPSNLKYQIFGESSLIRTATAILSLYLTFLAISD